MSYRTAKGLLEALKTVDGEGSGLDADLLRGLSPNKFVRTDVPSTIQVDNNFYPLVISGTSDSNNSFDSVGLALYPDKDTSKRVEYSSTRGGEFRIYCARYSTNILYSDNGSLKFLDHKVWHQGDVAQLLSSSGYIKFPNGLIIQWGVYEKSSPFVHGEKFDIIFPISFPTVLLSFACAISPGTDENNGAFHFGVAVRQNLDGTLSNFSTSGVGVKVWDVAGNTPPNGKGRLWWVAIGY